MKIAVLGGGIQGICAALALAQKPGREIHIVDRHDQLLQGASSIGEGKIHLGLVYAKDPTLETAKKLILDALSFAPLLESYIGHPIEWSTLVSNAFHYIIAKDSMLTISEHRDYYAAVNNLYNEHRIDPCHHYLGYSGKDIVDLPIREISDYQSISHRLSTEERAVDMSLLRPHLLTALHRRNVKIKTSCEVLRIDRQNGTYRVHYKTSKEELSDRYHKVINCLWDGRLHLDAQMNHLPRYPWLFRLKYRILVRNPDPAYHKSFTMVQGRYGDIVSYPQHDLLYLSWYPSCCSNMTRESNIPNDWLKQMSQSRPELIDHIGRETLANLAPMLPKIKVCDIQDIRAGVIYARGVSDIDDPESDLHHRYDHPITTSDGYFTVNTGKLTSAPRNAALLAKMIP